jgi:hypothetical protein
MAQALHLINGPGVNQKISAKGGLIDKLQEAKKSDPEMVEELYLDCFGRFPSEVEKSAALDAIDESIHPRFTPNTEAATPNPLGVAAARAVKAAERLALQKANAAKASKPDANVAAAATPAGPPAPKPLTAEQQQAHHQVFEDLLWALINGKEFVFNH